MMMSMFTKRACVCVSERGVWMEVCGCGYVGECRCNLVQKNTITDEQLDEILDSSSSGTARYVRMVVCVCMVVYVPVCLYTCVRPSRVRLLVWLLSRVPEVVEHTHAHTHTGTNDWQAFGPGLSWRWYVCVFGVSACCCSSIVLPRHRGTHTAHVYTYAQALTDKRETPHAPARSHIHAPARRRTRTRPQLAHTHTHTQNRVKPMTRKLKKLSQWRPRSCLARISIVCVCVGGWVGGRLCEERVCVCVYVSLQCWWLYVSESG